MGEKLQFIKFYHSVGKTFAVLVYKISRETFTFVENPQKPQNFSPV